MKPFAAARADFIAWCRDQLDEGPWEVPPGSNRNDYSAAVGRPPEAWCVDFGVAGLQATGSGGGIFPTASTRAHINWAKSVGRYRGKRSPVLGAFVAVAKNGTSVHTDACVVKASTSRLLAIGGNTSNRGGSTADGGGVYLNDRTYMLGTGSYRIYGYTVPFFGLDAEDVLEVQGKLGVARTRYMTPATVRAVKAFQRKHGLVVDGFPGPATFAEITGGISSPPPTPALALGGEFAAVDDTQRWLTALGYDPGPVDGKYGAHTAAATRQAQQDLGITPADGRPGPATRTHLEAAVSKLDDIHAWLAPIHRGGKKITIRQEVADAKTAALAAREQTGPIRRGGKDVTLRQEVADTKTLALAAEARDKAILAAVQAAASTGTPIDLDAVTAAAEQGVARAIASISADVTVNLEG